MTSKDLSIFNSLRPFSIGFDDMFDQFENMLGNGSLTMQSNYHYLAYFQIGQTYHQNQLKKVLES